MTNLRIPHYELIDGKSGRLLSDYVYTSSITTYTLDTEFIKLTQFGTITIKKGFNWDFATGAIDTPAMVAGSVVHDAFYWLIRKSLLAKRHREAADKEFKRILKTGGVGRFRRNYCYLAVRIGGAYTL